MSRKDRLIGITLKQISIIAFITISVFHCGCHTNTNTALINQYLPFLSNYNITAVKISKVDDNPSYPRPYNIYIRIKTDTVTRSYLKEIFKHHQAYIDTHYLKRVYSPLEYLNYFSMNSINAIRNSNLKNSKEWWIDTNSNKRPLNEAFFSPYLEKGGYGNLISDVRKANGRAGLYFDSHYGYIIIECWG